MRITLRIDGAEHVLRDLGETALVLGLDRCPRCGRRGEVHAIGAGRRRSADDRAHEADGFARCCGAPLGLIRAEADTIFGVEEDERVLRGRCRVY